MRGIKGLYTGDRSEIIWTAADIAPLKATCNANIANAVDLAAHTGLRLGDLLTVCWSARRRRRHCEADQQK
jgi:integrase